MKVANFRGRKNARRVNAREEKQHQLQEAEKDLKTANELAKSATDNKQQTEALRWQNQAIYLIGKKQRISQDIANLDKKIMEQGAAEAVRTKKNRSGQIRQKTR